MSAVQKFMNLKKMKRNRFDWSGNPNRRHPCLDNLPFIQDLRSPLNETIYSLHISLHVVPLWHPIRKVITSHDRKFGTVKWDYVF